MTFIQIGLLLLSLLQFVFLESFWQNSFYLFFLWIILFQILWFYIEKDVFKKIILLLLGILTVFNIAFLPQIPFLMIGLFVIELRKAINLKWTLLLLLTTLSLGFILLYSIPTVTEWVMLMAIIGLTLWITEQEKRRQAYETEWYQLVQMQEELTKQSQLLKAQMGSLEEVSRINERNRISRDLHDSVGHTLSTIVIQLAAISKISADRMPEVSEMVQALHQFTKDGLTNVREVIHALKPEDYQKIAFIDQLHALIQDFQKNASVQVFFNANDMLWLLNGDQEMLIFRAIQEFLSNTSKHSEATEVRIQYHFTDSSVILTMQDNGVGTATILPQMGLKGMEERVKLLGGKVTFQSASQQGFRTRIVLPKGGFMRDETKD